MTSTYPYSTGSGSVPVDTSEQRETWLVDTGVSHTMQEEVLQIVTDRGEYGITGKELRTLSSAPAELREYANGPSTLTGLYILGKLSKLREKRGGGCVYVLPDMVKGRDALDYVPAYMRRFTRAEIALGNRLIETFESDPSRTESQQTLLGLLKKIF